MRYRFPEVFETHGTTLYAVVKRSAGRLDAGTLYRLKGKGGRVRMVDGALVETLCELLGCPMTDVLELDTPRPAKVRKQ